jgi:hypothetical protein
MKLYIAGVLFIISMSLQAQEIKIHLQNGTIKEKSAKEQLEKIVKQYSDKISEWLFTNDIEIDENVVPFSHPVLTLNCNYLDNDLKQLANLLHEQFHWYEVSKPDQREKAICDFKMLFPQVPTGGREGARDNYSSYLHLIVCDLELQAMTKVTGEEKARQILSEWTHYTWIYDKVLNDKRIREINVKNHFIVH